MRGVRWAARLAVPLAALVASASAGAQTVSMSGSLGDKALLIIDGAPRTLATGATVQGVKLVSVSGHEAVVEVKGKRQTVQMGGAQVNLGGAPSEGGGSQIVLSATSGGHFVTSGAINGHAVRFLVDTGATYIALGASLAKDLGIDTSRGEAGAMNTANGPVVAHRVSLASVRVGDVQLYNVDAVVGGAMPPDIVLLGNSFLSRFQMKRDNDTLTLSRRY